MSGALGFVFRGLGIIESLSLVFYSFFLTAQSQPKCASQREGPDTDASDGSHMPTYKVGAVLKKHTWFLFFGILKRTHRTLVTACDVAQSYHASRC